jgi:hypothetical protein
MTIKAGTMIWSDISYRGFHDVPRIFVTRHHGQMYLFDCAFDEQIDDYPEQYQVFLMPELADADLPKDWTTLSARALRHLGPIPIADVQFDPSRRAQVDVSIIDDLMSAGVRASG